jgi:hypothetical protein
MSLTVDLEPDPRNSVRPSDNGLESLDSLLASGEVIMAKKALSSRDDEEIDDLTTDRDNELERIRQAVRGIRFGEVRVIIQDGLIVQIERVEKQRIR